MAQIARNRPCAEAVRKMMRNLEERATREAEIFYLGPEEVRQHAGSARGEEMRSLELGDSNKATRGSGLAGACLVE